MSNTLLVALREFRQRVRQRGFWLSSLLVPLILIIASGFSNMAGGAAEAPLQDLIPTDRPQQAIGYVDQAGLIQAIPAPVPADLFRAYPDVDAAEAALAAGEVAAYYRIPADYRQTGQVYRISPRLPTAPPDSEWFNWVLAGNLLPTASPDELARLRWPFNNSGPQFVSLTAKSSGRDGDDPLMLPMLITIAVMIPLFTSGGYLFQSLAQEKSNRIMEILLVSLRPRSLLTGKLLGLGALTLVQYTIWATIALGTLLVTGQDVAQVLGGIDLTAADMAWIVPYALGGFLLYAGLMAGIGALSPNMEGSRGWVFILGLPMMLPIYFSSLIISAPNGPLAIALSLFPFSAPVAMLMRLTSTAVPTWQALAGLALLFLDGVLIVWLMARLFRAQTLLSGESLSLSRMWSALSS